MEWTKWMLSRLALQGNIKQCSTAALLSAHLVSMARHKFVVGVLQRRRGGKQHILQGAANECTVYACVPQHLGRQMSCMVPAAGKYGRVLVPLCFTEPLRQQW